MQTPRGARELVAAGWELIQRSRPDTALERLRAACALAPTDSSAHFLRGVALHALGRFGDAVEAFDTAAAFDPSNRDAKIAPLGLLCALGRVDEARERCDRLIAATPDDADLRFTAGLVHEARGDLAAAVECYDAALVRDPRHRPSRLNRGLALTRLGRLEDAYANNRAAADAYPLLADSHYNLAEVALALRRYPAALEHCARSLALDSHHLGTLFDKTLALAALGRFTDSAQAWAAARAVDARAVDAQWASVSGHAIPASFSPETVYLSQAYARLRECDWGEREGFIATVRTLVAERPENLPTERALAFAATTLPLSQAERIAVASAVANHIERSVGTPVRRRATLRTSRLRVGYLSQDFRDHVVGRLALPLFEHHDRTTVDVLAYSLAPDDGSSLRRALSSAADHFRDLAALDHRAAAESIAADGIDILVDLAGYTEGARPEILALRPASIQVTYLGFAGSTGASYIDYALTDRVTTPPGNASWWRERLVFLPHTHFLYEPVARVATPPARADYGLPADRVVFCAFHSAHKIGPESFSAWLDALCGVPGSVLWLLDNGAACTANLRAVAQAGGVDPGRLIIAPRQPLEGHLARLPLADLFLDAFQYNAMASACDALSMGLPVLTLTGEAPPARVATSLLAAGGLASLTTNDRETFVARAVELALDPDRLRALRAQTQAAGRTGPLFDTHGRVRAIEAAYARMAARAREGLPPASFEVPADPGP